MSERLTTLAGALLALFIFVALLYQPATEDNVSRPTTLDNGPDGYLGLWRWLTHNNVRQASLKRPFTSLTEQFPIPGNDTGHILIVTFPFSQTVREDELVALDRWVGAGNTLLIMAALNETPRWALSHAANFIENLAALSHTQFDTVNRHGDQNAIQPVDYNIKNNIKKKAAGDDEDKGPDKEADKETDKEADSRIVLGTFNVLEPLEMLYESTANHPLMQNVHSLAGVTDSTTTLWQPRSDANAITPLQLATVSGHGSGALWQQHNQHGVMVISGSATLLANRRIDEADNAQFVANLIHYHLHPQGTVIFDDYHHGISELYDPDAFFADARLHNTLWLLIAFWLLYMVGSSGRLGRQVIVPDPLQQSSLVRALAGFLQRKLAPADAGLLMIQNWLAKVSARQPSADPWHTAQAMPLVDPVLLRRLKAFQTELQSGRTVPLKQITNLITQLERSRG